MIISKYSWKYFHIFAKYTLKYFCMDKQIIKRKPFQAITATSSPVITRPK